MGARLIAHAGTLINLAKAPASTVQILGAEKALFRALKTKHATPKYGLLFHASLIGQASPKNKGKIARVLAAKCALAIRVDALGESAEAQMGLDSRAKVRAVLFPDQWWLIFALSDVPSCGPWSAWRGDTDWHGSPQAALHEATQSSHP